MQLIIYMIWEWELDFISLTTVFSGWVHGQLARWRRWSTCDVGEATEGLENEQSSFSNSSVTSPASQLILKPFCCFTYITVHSPTFPSLHLCHRHFTCVTGISPLSQAFHLCHRHFTSVTGISPLSQAFHLCHRHFTHVTWRGAHDKIRQWNKIKKKIRSTKIIKW